MSLHLRVSNEPTSQCCGGRRQGPDHGTRVSGLVTPGTIFCHHHSWLLTREREGCVLELSRQEVDTLRTCIFSLEPLEWIISGL